MHLDIATANLHVVSHHQVEAVRGIVARIKRVFGRRPDVIGVQEAIGLQHVKRVGRYRVVKAHRAKLHDRTNVVLLKRWFAVESSTWHFGAPAFGTGLNHNPRHFHVVKFRKWGQKAAIIDTHLSVIREPRGRFTSVHHVQDPVARTHGIMAVKVADKADQLRAEGYVVTVTADSNDNTGWAYALRTVLERRGYRIVAHGIDIIAVHPSQVRLRAGRIVIPKHITRSDHEAVAAGFDVRGRYRGGKHAR